MQRAVDEAIEAIEALSSVKCPIEEYVEALDGLRQHIVDSMMAADEDINRGRGK